MIPARSHRIRRRPAWMVAWVLQVGTTALAGTTPPTVPTTTTVTSTTSSTLTTLPGGPFCSFFDVFVEIVPLPMTRLPRATVEGTPCPVTPGGTGGCTDHTLNVALSDSSGCWNVNGRSWPSLAFNEARLILQADANLKCIDTCLLYSCPTRGGRPYCVQRGTTLENLACRPAAGPPDCSSADEGRYTCTATLTLCKCRCSKSAFF